MTRASRRWRRTDGDRAAQVSGEGCRRKGRAAGLLLLALALALAQCQAGGISTPAGPEGPAQTEFAPRGGPGRVVMLLSGHSGPRLYEEYATALADEGYDVVVLDGKDILAADQKGGERLAAAITRAQRSPHALPGKVAVIGFSQGGGGALTHAARWPVLVAAVVAYYPETDFMARYGGVAAYVARFRVPVLVLAGGVDTYHDCCLIGTMREMEKSARERGADFALVVYPEAEHGFNLRIGLRPGDAEDAWRRANEMLQAHFAGSAS
jgi:pimeloyl-ACP methyl ester carboxylesterase